ncbi:uncharacterized protein LOC129567924 [Sitodiplosis mosellana]|uniref:uncharacterized protein LOC129567924 n=1 Tax=Sitodiplosis mosellana TaxID=263140 RepID=UPI00244445EF|nr:uncharacterized protein LOC129567924 [Sitodiplosis mosellana]
MLWKKDSNRKTALYVDYFADLGTDLADLDAIQNQLKSMKKSDAVSERLREEGNIEFAARNWTNAIMAYNYALCFAENGSEALSHAYANRSPFFFELDQFDSCCTDIKLALEVSECSDSLKQSIVQHQKDCADFIENSMSIESTVNVPTLDFEPNKSFPCFANVLQLDRHTELGYRITAKTDIDVGKRIFVEKSLVSTAIDGQYMRCSVCLTRSNNLIPCGNCTKAMFCNTECQNSILHAAECGMATAIESDGKLTFLIRTVLYAMSLFNSANDFVNFVEKCIDKQQDFPLSMTDDRSKYEQFLRLKPDRMIASGEKRDPLIYFAYQAIMASKAADWFVLKKQQRFLTHLIWQHEAIISLGCVHQYTDKNGQADSLHLFPTFRQFNHLCSPNAMFHLADNWSTITTMRPIKKGEEVTVSYFGRNFPADSMVERQEYVERLRDNFGNKCQCDLCENRTSTAGKRKAMKADPSYQNILQTIEQNFGEETSLDMKEMKHHAIEFLEKFGQAKWCAELHLATTFFMDINWAQIESGDLE